MDGIASYLGIALVGDTVRCCGVGGVASVVAGALPAQVDTLALNRYLRLVVTIMVIAVLALVLLGVFWTALKCLVWQSKDRRAEIEGGNLELHGDSSPPPPASGAMCDVCAKPIEKVNLLPTGRRMCDDCYRHLYLAGPGQGGGGGPSAGQQA